MSGNEYYLVKRGSTSLQNKVIQSGLSSDAVFLLLFQLSLPPGTPLGYRSALNRGLGRDRILNGFKELSAAGFRHQYKVRTATGILKTITVVTDVSMKSRDVLKEIQLPKGHYVFSIETNYDDPKLPPPVRPKVEGSGRQIRRSHRAPETRTRCDQAKSEPGSGGDSKPLDNHKPAVRTVRRKTGTRSASAGRSPNTLRVNNNNHPSPQTPQVPSAPPPAPRGEEGPASPSGVPPVGGTREDNFSPENMLSDATGLTGPMAGAPADEPAGGVAVKTRPVAVAKATQVEDSTLVAEVLPANMQAIPTRSHSQVANAIRQRLDAGWRREQITRVLGSRALPSHVIDLTRLVMARFRDDLSLEYLPPIIVERDPAALAAPASSMPAMPVQQSRRWRWTLPNGHLVTVRDLDMGRVSIDYLAAQDAGDPRAYGSKFDFLEAVGAAEYLLDSSLKEACLKLLSGEDGHEPSL